MRINKEEKQKEGKAHEIRVAWHLELVRLRDEKGWLFRKLAEHFKRGDEDYIRSCYHRTKRRLKGFAGQRPRS